MSRVDETMRPVLSAKRPPPRKINKTRKKEERSLQQPIMT